MNDEQPKQQSITGDIEMHVSSLELEDKESIINQIPISKFNKNSIQMMEGKLAKAPLSIQTDEQVLEQQVPMEYEINPKGSMSPVQY